MKRPIRVLVTDDSPAACSLLSGYLTGAPDIEVVGMAAGGTETVEKTRSLRPDVVTLDVMMPRLEGLRALRCIMNELPTPVILVSVLNRQGADVAMQGLRLGAIDVVHRRLSSAENTVDGMAVELRDKVRAAATARLMPMTFAPAPRGSENGTAASAAWRDNIVVIGASGGGVQALRTVISSLPPGFGAPVLVVQHMAAYFTRALAKYLDEITPLRVREAERGMSAEPGTVLVAPGGLHLTIDRSRTIGLNRRPLECGARPSVDIAIESAVQSFGSSVAGVVLTGMGRDGARGAGLLRESGGEVIVQDPATAVVTEMPEAVLEEGCASEVLPLEEIAGGIVRRCRARDPGLIYT